MAASLEGSLQKRIDHGTSRRLVGEARTHGQRIGVIVAAGEPCDLDAVAQRRADAMHLVPRHLLSVAAATKEEGGATLLQRSRAGTMHVERVIHGLGAHGAHIGHGDPLLCEMALHRLFERVAGVVAAEDCMRGHDPIIARLQGFDYALHMRKTLIAANWKMHPAPAGFDAGDSPYRTHAGCDVVVFPAATDLHRVRAAELLFGAQCGRPESDGAFTGDLSMAMLHSEGCRYVLCGHSERRMHHGDTDDDVMQQVVCALEHDMHPIVCIGETEDERKAKKTHAVLTRQLHGLPIDPRIVIAYEPVWAIGSGRSATTDDVQEAHAFIRSQLPDSTQADTRILYGGSVTPDNAEELLSHPEVDGLLVGGASLDGKKFAAIVAVAMQRS